MTWQVKFRRLFVWLLIAIMIVPAIFSAIQVQAEKTQPTVYYVPVHKDVEKGLYAFLQRAFTEAENNNADAIILDIHTPGGFTHVAGDIALLMDNTKMRKIAYVNKDAHSAGAFIALHADEIYMAPNATIGAAGVITSDGNAADLKAQSAWIAQMKAAAESKGLNPLYAEAMANAEIDLPKYRAPKGEFLTLSADEAANDEVNYSKGTVANFDDLLQATNLADAKVVESEPTVAENLARIITNPVVVPILLSIASLGLIMELYTPGFGIPGGMGILALILFFYGHLVAGFAGYESILILVIGIALIIIEYFVPGGVLGFIGVIMMLGSLLLAGANVTQMMYSIIIALLVAVVGVVVMMKFFGKKMTALNRLVLRDATTTEDGYVSNVNRVDLIGRTGEALTTLRPSGTALVEDERLDVVTEGSYIEAGTMIEIIKVEGSRIVVREL